MAQQPQDEWVDDEVWVDDESDFVDDPITPEQVSDSPSVLNPAQKYFTPMTDIGRRSARGLRNLLGEGNSPLEKLSRKAVLPITDFIGSAVDEASSPVNAVPTILSGGAGLARGGLSRLLNLGSQITSAPTAIHGGMNIAEGETLTDKALGALELAGGLVGMRGRSVPKVKTPIDSAPEMSFEDLQKRVYELMDKDVAGTLTDAELTEAQKLNKLWRDHPQFGIDNVVKSIPSEVRLDYSPSSEKKAREIISSYGETNFEGMTNKQIIEMAESIEPGWQSKLGKTVTTPKELTKPGSQPIRMKLNEDGTFSPDGDPSVRIDPKTGKITKTEVTPEGIPTQVQVDEPGLLSEVLALPRALQSSMDLSFPFRQGLGLIHHKGWWKAWPDMVKSFGSDKAFKGVMDSIAERPNFRKSLTPDGKVKPSFADESGLAITDNLTTREHEYFNNKFANIIPGVKASNRAYTAFANKLRADVFDSLVDDFTKAGIDPRKNKDLARELAAYVNNASGRGNLGALEKSADTLGHLYFSPRLLASRANMMGKGTTSLFREGYDLFKNPKAYVAAPPNVRKEYLKSMLALGSAWGTIAGLGAAAGGEVSMDATNSDFGKIKIGNTRIDPGGGFQQFAVLAQRLAPERLGGMRVTGSESGETKFFKDAKSKYDPTWGSTVGNFNYSKSSPLARYIWDWATQTQEKGKSTFDATDATARLFTPIIVQDLLEILNDPKATPEELATLPLNAIGMGTQTYGAGRDFKRRMLGGLGQ